jgi:hypothetical protein
VVYKNEKVDWKVVIYKSIGLYIIEYLILLSCQIVSYLLIGLFWMEVSWQLPAAMDAAYIPVCVCFYAAQKYKQYCLTWIF